MSKIEKSEGKTIYEHISEVRKEVDENKVNRKLQNKWVLLTVGNMYQITAVKDGNMERKAIGQTPYYVLGKLRGM